MSGTETLKGRPAKPVKVAESDVDVSIEDKSVSYSLITHCYAQNNIISHYLAQFPGLN